MLTPNSILNADIFDVFPQISDESIDLIIADPPFYLLNNKWDKKQWATQAEYLEWCIRWFNECFRVLKPSGSIYIFQDWRLVSEFVVELKKIFPHFHNWITWERNKGRASKSNFKSSKEEILYFSKSKKPVFNEQKKIRPVIAPYKNEDGTPKGWFCYSDDTEILTENGWRFFYDLTNHDKVYSVNNSLETTLEIPKKIIRYKYSGDMYHIKNKLLDFLVTPEHKFIIKNRKNQHYKSLNVEQIQNEMEIPSIGVYNHTKTNEEYFYLNPTTNQYTTTNGLKCKYSTFIKFLAIFLAEGQYCRYKNSYKLTIYQSKHVELFKKVFMELGLKFSSNVDKKGMTRFVVSNKELYVYLLENFSKNKHKVIPNDFINSLSIDNIKIFLEYFRLGDGSEKNKKCNPRYYNTSKSIIDAIQHALYIINIPSTILKRTYDNPKWKAVYICQEKNKIKMGINKKNINIKKYDGYVNCVNVNNKNIILRRNGKMFCCGNCDEEGNRVRWTGVGNVWHYTPPVWSSILDKPIHPTQKPLMMLERMVEASSNEGDFVLDLFSGSGVASLACQRLKRNFIGIEKSEKFHELASKRLK